VKHWDPIKLKCICGLRTCLICRHREDMRRAREWKRRRAANAQIRVLVERTSAQAENRTEAKACQ
jgi:hypothetical protein